MTNAYIKLPKSSCESVDTNRLTLTAKAETQFAWERKETKKKGNIYRNVQKR